MRNSDDKSGKAPMSTALTYLSRRQMTAFQLTKKLEQKGFASDEIAEVLNKLVDWKYLDDRSYAINYCKSKRDKYSRARIKMELQKAGIDKQVIFSVLDELYFSDREYTNCLDLGQSFFMIEKEKWQNKYIHKSKYPFEMHMKKRIGDKLLQKGYTIDVVRNVLAEIMSEENF